MGGLDVIRSLKGGARVPVIVVVTAYDKFALQAFDAGAIDYLLKPVRHERLAEALERAKRLSGREQSRDWPGSRTSRTRLRGCRKEESSGGPARNSSY